MLHYHNFEQKQEIEEFTKKLKNNYPDLKYQLCVSTHSHNNGFLNKQIQIAVIVSEYFYQTYHKELFDFLYQNRTANIYYFLSSELVQNTDEDINGGVFI